MTVEVLTLHKTTEHSTPGLQERMANNDFQKAFQSFPALLNDGIVELVEVDLARQWRDGDTCRLALEDVAEVLKVRVAAPHAAVTQLERRYVGAEGNLVGRISRARRQAVGLWVFDLEWPSAGVTDGGRSAANGLRKEDNGEVLDDIPTYFDLEEVLRRTVDFLEALRARIWHRLHC